MAVSKTNRGFAVVAEYWRFVLAFVEENGFFAGVLTLSVKLNSAEIAVERINLVGIWESEKSRKNCRV